MGFISAPAVARGDTYWYRVVAGEGVRVSIGEPAANDVLLGVTAAWSHTSCAP